MEDVFNFGDGLFSGAMLVSERVHVSGMDGFSRVLSAMDGDYNAGPKKLRLGKSLESPLYNCNSLKVKPLAGDLGRVYFFFYLLWCSFGPPLFPKIKPNLEKIDHQSKSKLRTNVNLDIGCCCLLLMVGFKY